MLNAVGRLFGGSGSGERRVGSADEDGMAVVVRGQVAHPIPLINGKGPARRGGGSGKKLPSSYADSVMVSVRELSDPPRLMLGGAVSGAITEGEEGGKTAAALARVQAIKQSIVSNTKRLFVENYPSALVPRTQQEKAQIRKARQYDKVQQYLALEETHKQRCETAFNTVLLETRKRFYYLQSVGRRLETDGLFRRMVMELAKQQKYREHIEFRQYNMRATLRRLQAEADMAQLDQQFVDMYEAIVEMREDTQKALLGGVDANAHRQKLDELRDRSDRLDNMQQDKGLAVDDLMSSLSDRDRVGLDMRMGGGAGSGSGGGGDYASSAAEDEAFLQCFRSLIAIIDPQAAALQQQREQQQQQQAAAQQSSPVVPIVMEAPPVAEPAQMPEDPEQAIQMLREVAAQYESIPPPAAVSGLRRSPALVDPGLGSLGGMGRGLL